MVMLVLGVVADRASLSHMMFPPRPLHEAPGLTTERNELQRNSLYRDGSISNPINLKKEKELQINKAYQRAEHAKRNMNVSHITREKNRTYDTSTRISSFYHDLKREVELQVDGTYPNKDDH